MTRALVVTLALLAGCKLDTKYGGTMYQCGVPERCPGGFVCIDGYCQEDPGGDGDGGPTIDASDNGPLVGGDILFMTFDDLNTPLLWDRSGHRHDAHQGGVDLVAGRYGGGVELDPDDSLLVADVETLFTGSEITIEAWVNRTQGGVSRGIYGDRAVTGGAPPEASLEVDPDDHLVFQTNHNCAPVSDPIAVSTGVVPVASWAHVAVAWDGAATRFYINGEPAGETELTATACAIDRQHRIGRRTGDPSDAALTGLIDEVKVSSVAKTQEDIQASMAFDSTELIGTCGDGIVEMQACERDALCCSGSCDPASNGGDCAGGAGTCEDGVCAIVGGRVEADVIARWAFDEGSGAIIADSAGIEPPIDLTIADEAAVDWITDGLDILTDPAITAMGDTSRLAMACAASDEVTLELWITPQNVTAFGQIASLSDGTGNLNLGVQQIGPAYLVKLRSEGSTGDGTPGVDSADGDASTQLTHLVITRTDDGARRVYVNGRLRSESVVPGQLDWLDRQVTIGDEAEKDDPWLGTFHFMAIHDRAISSAEVAQNYTAGPP